MSSQGCGLRADLVDLRGSLVLEPCLNQIVGQWGRGGPILLRIPSSPALQHRREGKVGIRRGVERSVSEALPQRMGSVYHCVMAERAMPAQSPSRYAAVAALFAALEELMDDYRSLPDAEHVRQWSEDADRITGEVARHLAVARARISAAPPHDAR